jgi:hypothetical protein
MGDNQQAGGWTERAARHLKAELKRADLSNEDLAEKLKTGFKETRTSIARPFRSLFLAALVAIGCASVTLGDI